jgi:hypothetical protein
MGPVEIASRVAQSVSRRSDSLGLFLPKFEQSCTDVSEQSGWFFFASEDVASRISLIRKNVPGLEDRVLGEAERILRNQYSLLGYGSLDYGEEVDWQLDRVSGVRAPLVPWPRLDHQDVGTVGDSKVTWELNRHQFLVTLAKAWLLTGDGKYVRKLEDLFDDWQKKNPYPLGINWGSSLEVAFRSLSWIWVRELLAGCPHAGQLRLDMGRALGFNGWYINRYLSTYFAPNTHLLGEGVGLFFIGTLCPSLPDATKWRETGWNIVLKHAREKVLQDGAYYEQSTYYHVYALDFFLHARVLAERTGLAIPRFLDEVISRMLVHLAYLCQAGSPPRFGDDDGGRVFDPGRNRGEHLSDPLAIGAAIYQMPIMKPYDLAVTEEMLWLLGEPGLQAFTSCPEQKVGESATFRHTGLYVSHARDHSRSQVVMDAGPLGGGSGGHGHADALSLNLNLDGSPMLVDPGAYRYFDPDGERNRFRSTRSHNTISVDGLSQAEPKTLFSWFRWPEVTVEALAFEEEFDFIAASHDGYQRLASPATHRRTLFAPREGYWFVLDELASDGAHDYELHWHLAPDVELKQQDDHGWIVGWAGTRLHLVTAADGWSLGSEPGWVSPSYGRKEAATVLSASKAGQGNEAVATLLWREAPGTSVPTMSKLPGVQNASAYRLDFGSTCSICISGSGQSKVVVGDWETDARFLWATLAPDGSPVRVIAIQSATIRYKGTAIQYSSGKEGHVLWQET